MKNYQYILLDWDGNLAKTLDLWLEACRVPLEKRGLHLSDNEVASCFGMLSERFQEWGITDIEQAIEELHEVAAERMPEVDLYPEVLPVLEKLRMADKKIALVTGTRRAHVLPILDKYNIHHFFDVIVTGEDTERHKPDPQPLEKALELLDGTVEQAVVIGDSDKDIGAANNAGIDSILFFPPEHARFYDRAELEALHPTWIVDDFRQVFNIIHPPVVPRFARAA
jgi:pyrophosphatase PpaX